MDGEDRSADGNGGPAGPGPEEVPSRGEASSEPARDPGGPVRHSPEDCVASLAQEHAVGLEARLAERTAELAQARHELQTLTDSVAHDLRAPVRAMHGFAQALLEDHGGHMDEDAHALATRILAAAQRMDGLMQDLAAFGRVYRREIPLQRVELDRLLPELVDEIDAESHACNAAIRIDPPLPPVRGNRALVRQILGHLLRNAVKFVAPDVAPRIRVAAEPDAGRVRIWVEDNGLGVAEEHYERIFRPFERLHGIEAYPGSGLGLAVVHQGTRRMNGCSGVLSTPGRGSRFWIQLPAAEERHGEAQLRNPAGGGQPG